jgi:NAD(P)-dependent dehydrogenase (short-subunit alcohol dehydrogenase family)
MASIFRDNLLSGRVAFVTGGGSGIGLRMAERFAEHGATVVLCGRKQNKLDAAKERIGARAITEALDVREYEAVEAAMRRTHAAAGPIDIVVAAAAGNFPASVTGMSAHGFKAVIDIDVLGTFNTVRASWEFLRKPGASVLAISAQHAHTPFAYQSHVCAAKAGVELLIRTLAVEWGPAGVRCNCITPGPTADTEGMARLAPTPEALSRVEKAVPLQRLGTKDELADLALFLCSEAAAYVTGAIYACDGGPMTSSLFASAGTAELRLPR